MSRLIAGAVVGAIGLIGLFVAARAGSGEPGYGLGMLIAVGALVVLFILLKGHYDAQERNATASAAETAPARADAPAGGSGSAPRVPALGLLPSNPWDNMVVALLAGILSLGGGIVATYNSGLGWAFGMLMFFGFGLIVLAAGWKMWTVGFIEEDRQDA